MPDGILNIDKPLGKTSHDVVEQVRELTNVRRVGHAGTLDPLATGVLLVCVGRSATRVAEFLMDEPKTYHADARLGITTDTFDAEGEIVAELPVGVDRDEVEEALEHFRGSIGQTPPMYSAVKYRGKPLYRLARRGVEVERASRRVEIHRLELVRWDPPTCTLEVRCSAGTYVRVLVHDLGQTLGCGAHVTGLTRLASGNFRLEDSATLGQFAQMAKERRWSELLCPVDEALADQFPALHLDADAAWRFCSGQAIESSDRTAEDGGLVRVYGPEGRFLALASYDADGGNWRPRKVFVSPYPGSRSEGDGQG
jgi:tRNA pseudouridine55 synthase